MNTQTTAGVGGRWWTYPVLSFALAAGIVTGAGFALAHLGVIGDRTERLFYVVALPLGGWHWARESVERVVRECEVGIDLLMLAAALGSIVLGLWDEAAFLVFLYGAAEGLEEYTYFRTRSAIRALLGLAPKEARVLRDGREELLAAESLRPGDRFLVRPGEAIATDGIIRSGTSSLDESSVTGESIPVDKGSGMPVFAGTLNRQGALEVEATASLQDNTLAKIIHLVEEAQEQKGRAQQWIERFGRRYSPAVLLAGGLLVLVPWVAGLPPGEWSVRAVVLLVAAAPCALVMSTPVAIAAGILRAGRRGILIKGGVHLEHLAAIRAVAFDKTGTITHGQPAVTDVVALDGDEHGLLALAAGIERFSEHPLARAVVTRARALGIQPTAAHGFEALVGAGATAVVGAMTWHVGSPELFAELGVNLDHVRHRLNGLQEEGKTVVLVGNRDGVRGAMALQDPIRPEAQEVVASLLGAGLHLVMLTGDNERTARAVARAVGIERVLPHLKPEDKARAIERIEHEAGAVLMVGDGINDAPALAVATCGVAMGVIGSDAAIEAADVALMSDDLTKILEALQRGRRARRISRQNIAFSLVVLAALLPAALAGALSVAVAVLAHELSELLAVANGLRVGRPTG